MSRKLIIYCDRCRKEIEGNPAKLCAEFYDREKDDFTDGIVPGTENVHEKDYCVNCISDIFRYANKKPVATVNQDFEAQFEKPDPAKTEPEKPADSSGGVKPETGDNMKPAKKKWYLNAEDKALVREMYSEKGMEMEDIADALNISAVPISRFIQEEKLGEKRYAGQTIPSKGSAPIAQCSGYCKGGWEV